MADAGDTSVVIPAYNEGTSIASVVSGLRAAGAWREILVVDDGSTDDTAAQAARAGARVVRHPYNKSNGAAVETRIPESAGGCIPSGDADRQHQPSDALRLVAGIGSYALVVGARSGRTHAGLLRRLGNAVLNAIASYLTEVSIPDLTSGFRAARRAHLHEFLHLLPNGFSTPTTTTLAFIKAGYSVRFETVEAADRDESRSASKIRLGSDGVGFFLTL